MTIPTNGTLALVSELILDEVLESLRAREPTLYYAPPVDPDPGKSVKMTPAERRLGKHRWGKTVPRAERDRRQRFAEAVKHYPETYRQWAEDRARLLASLVRYRYADYARAIGAIKFDPGRIPEWLRTWVRGQWSTLSTPDKVLVYLELKANRDWADMNGVLDWEVETYEAPNFNDHGRKRELLILNHLEDLDQAYEQLFDARRARKPELALDLEAEIEVLERQLETIDPDYRRYHGLPTLKALAGVQRGPTAEDAWGQPPTVVDGEWLAAYLAAKDAA